jgi:cysteinyl-tRNA synthetase
MHGYFLQLNEVKMAKSAAEFLRLQTLMARGYDPLAYRFFCLSAHYRATLNFTWESLDGAMTALNRLRSTAHAWGAPGTIDIGYVNEFTQHIHNDLNMPRAMALTWELVKSDLPPSTKQATLWQFDRVLGLRLADWQPAGVAVPEAILGLVQQRQRARAERRWHDADVLRGQIESAGYTIDDTPQGPRVRAHMLKPLT